MLDGGGDEVLALGGVGLHDALERPVIALRAAGGEEDFAGLGADDAGELLTGFLDGVGRAAGEAVRAGRVGELVKHVGAHGLEGRFTQPRGGGVIEIDHEKVASFPVVDGIYGSGEASVHAFLGISSSSAT